MSRVLFSGYYGLGNAGDEAVLEASVAMFRERRPGIGVAALSGDPRRTSETLGIRAVPRMRPDRVLPALAGTSLFLSGGGSLLQDRTSLKSLLYYLWLLRLARVMGKKTMVFAQGVGPLVRPQARELTARVLSRVDAITVRDVESAELLTRIGVVRANGAEPEVTADPVFALEPEPTARVQALTRDGQVIGVSLRPWDGVEAILDPLADSLRGFSSETRIQAWALYPEEDLPVCEALAKRVPAMEVIREPLRPREWVALAERSTVVLGMRLHSLIFAAARAVPIVGISYDPKVDALLTRVRGVSGGSTDAVDAERVAGALSAALAQASRGRADRAQRAAHLRDRAGRNVDRALELL